MEVGDVFNLLTENELIDTELELIDYKKESTSNNINTYRLRINIKEKNKTKEIILKETYPNQFKIVLDF